MQNYLIEEVRSLLQKFQDGYTARDQNRLNTFMELFSDKDQSLEVIGTFASEPGENEWCRGRDAVRQMISSDWEHWGDVTFDVSHANIFVHENVAWLSTTAQVKDIISNEYRYRGFLEFAKDVIDEEPSKEDDKSKMLDILLLGNELLAEILKGETCIWPFRFTALAVKQNNRWQFHHMQFSFATTRAPDIRLQ